ncbi:MAG: levansucrase [Rhodobacteraceae bacterium]|nr:levansucrase [Paracoccaceae bacterium]MCY4197532.1 levansucrase [Paracoccaceae bacterium]MCY4326053.1 levansucrase [Paracoccaceae bacterium]
MNDKWIWDFWLARDDDRRWHCYFLQADKSLGDPEFRHFNVTQGHASSCDLVNWTHHGTCFAPARTRAWDDCTTWTGSVLKGANGLWHYFYTGTQRSENGLKQRIGHAVGHDMHNWERVGTGLALDLDPSRYEEYKPGFWHDRALRDPWVMPHPEGTGWLMAYTARVPASDEPNANGAIGLAVSEDLDHWEAGDPLYVGSFGQLEVPQIFALNGTWYCLFSVGRDHWSRSSLVSHPWPRVRGTHYLIAESFDGPWQLAPGPFLTSVSETELYACRILFDNGAPFLMGFLHDTPDGEFIGAISDPIRVDVSTSGLLSLAL